MAQTRELTLELDHQQLAAVFGQQDANLRLIEDMFATTIVARDGALKVQGREADKAVQLLESLAEAARQGQAISEADLRHAGRAIKRDAGRDLGVLFSESILTSKRGARIRPRTAGQARYVQALARSELVFCIGPAGTGKSYLALAMGVAALRDKRVGRLVLTKPVVEAGERLGYLPGALLEKVDPYMRPLYDALDEMLGAERTQRYIERRAIEVAPLAYMRGRTLNDAFILLDEAQNTTRQQMKMFLTRLGFGSQMVVTGDITQVDLPDPRASGMTAAMKILAGLRGVESVELAADDVVRHKLVQEIVEAYDRAASQGSEAGD